MHKLITVTDRVLDAAKPDIATKLYDEFNEKLRKQNVHVETGIFGAMMKQNWLMTDR